jgi:branched-chain amino acid aminotransferase
MIVFLNGRFVAAERAVISVFDRGFLYGDGLFETVRIFGGKPFRWEQHDERLRRGAEFLKLRVPFPPADLSRLVRELIARNGSLDSVLRLTLSRGVGPRGYSTKDADSPSLVMALHPSPPFAPGNPPPVRLMTASIRVPADDALAGFKSCNKLPQILARAEAEARGANEALLLNTRDEVAETAAGNLFWVAGGEVCTTPLATGVLAGVTRAVMLEICAARSVPTAEAAIAKEELGKAEGVFVTNSSAGVMEAVELDGQPLRRSPLVGELQAAYQALVLRECYAG